MDIINFHEKHSKRGLLSDFILGGQDGLVNVLGVILGVSAATSDIRLILVAAFAALGAESISMGAVAYTSTLARRRQYLKEVEREKREMKEVPKMERKEVWEVFKEWGYKGKELERMTDGIIANPKAWLEFMMAFELKLQPVEKEAPKNSFFVVLAATILGSVIPVIPFLLTGNIFDAQISAIAVSAIFLFAIGYYEAKATVGSLWKSGLEMLIIGIAAGIAGYLIGKFFGASPI